MRRNKAFFIAALIGSALMVLLSMPVQAQDEGDYAHIDDDYYADTYAPRQHHAQSHDTPYLAKAYQPHHGGGHYAYGHQKRHYHHDYPRSRKACVYGPLREKKVCDYRPRHCWKERECYYIYGKKYCRYFTKCRGGDRHCYWTKRNHGGHSSCYY